MLDCHDTVDVVILGAGMAGMSAAARAAEAGARVVVLERAPTIGGSAVFSHGNVWTVANAAQLETEDPGEYRRHATGIVVDFESATDWLCRFGGAVGSRKYDSERKGQRFDIPLTFLRMAQRIQSAGGGLITSAEVEEVVSTTSGFQIKVLGGSPGMRLVAKALVIATGGRQADQGVRNELAPGASAMLRGNPYSDGAGIRHAMSLGAAVNFANRGFYGHLVPSRIEPLLGLDLLALTLYHSAQSILLDRSGERFTDELLGDARNATALATRGGLGLLLWTEAVQQVATTSRSPVSPAMNRWQYARDRGGRVARVARQTDIEGAANGWGFGGVSDMRALGEGPVYLAEVRPAITFTYGGLRATATGRVLDVEGNPIPNLFTAGADMSDIYHLGYCGGLSAATVTGTRAGGAAAVAALSKA